MKIKEPTLSSGKIETDTSNAFYENRKTMRELISSTGINPNPLDYMEVDDNGIRLYTMCFYVDKIPQRLKFASTFAPIFNFPEVTSSVFINPLTEGRSSKKLDKRVITLDTERIAAEKNGDINRARKITRKLRNTEQFAEDVESGDNRLYEVQFLFTVQAVTLDRLRLIVSDFHNRARERGIELAACYSVHPEAFVSGYTTNRIFNARAGLVKSNVVKTHIFDKGAFCTIFNHTRSRFSHNGGIVAGRNMSTGQLVQFNVYDASHNGFGLVICGKTGTGKSATVKMYQSRYLDFDYVIRSIDFDARGTMGEYAMMAQAVGGVNFQIKQNSKYIINLFELDKEEEFDEITGKEYPVLNLTQKIVDVCNLIMIMVQNGNKIDKFDDVTTISRIVTDTVSELYALRGIVDGDVDSLYTEGRSLQGGRFSSGKVKKQLPTITDFYKRLLVKQKENRINHYVRAYQLLLDSMKDYVKELYYCPECLKFYTLEEYQRIHSKETALGEKKCCSSCMHELTAIRGVRAYFDGQSTVRADQDTPHINIDISQLTDSEKKIAMLIAMNFLQEQCIKKNSVNPKKAKKMIFMTDELHRVFPFDEARIFISDVYRTARKRNVSPWAATQSLADFDGYKETRAIIDNTTSFLLLKHEHQNKEYLKTVTPLTDSEVERVMNLGGDPDDEEDKNARKGEVCLIDNGKVVFLKVDYLTDSEALIVETSIEKIREMYKGKKVG